MISSKERQELNAAAVEVFGMMYFTPVELLPELPPREDWHRDDPYIKTQIGYSGPLRANLCFYFPRPLAISITGGFLGIDEENISDQQLIDTMRESANMIVGNFLGRLDPQGACTLGIPEACVAQGFSPETVTPDENLLAFVTDFGLLWMVYSS